LTNGLGGRRSSGCAGCRVEAVGTGTVVAGTVVTAAEDVVVDTETGTVVAGTVVTTGEAVVVDSETGTVVAGTVVTTGADVVVDGVVAGEVVDGTPVVADDASSPPVGAAVSPPPHAAATSSTTRTMDLITAPQSHNARRKAPDTSGRGRGSAT
jgi:hypothetical protein